MEGSGLPLQPPQQEQTNYGIYHQSERNKMVVQSFQEELIKRNILTRKLASIEQEQARINEENPYVEDYLLNYCSNAKCMIDILQKKIQDAQKTKGESIKQEDIDDLTRRISIFTHQFENQDDVSSLSARIAIEYKEITVLQNRINELIEEYTLESKRNDELKKENKNHNLKIAELTREEEEEELVEKEDMLQD